MGSESAGMQTGVKWNASAYKAEDYLVESLCQPPSHAFLSTQLTGGIALLGGNGGAEEGWSLLPDPAASLWEVTLCPQMGALVIKTFFRSQYFCSA